MAVSVGCSRGTRTNAGDRQHARGRPRPAPPADRKYLLERVDDAAVVQLYADGFDDAAAR